MCAGMPAPGLATGIHLHAQSRSRAPPEPVPNCKDEEGPALLQSHFLSLGYHPHVTASPRLPPLTEANVWPRPSSSSGASQRGLVAPAVELEPWLLSSTRVRLKSDTCGGNLQQEEGCGGRRRRQGSSNLGRAWRVQAFPGGWSAHACIWQRQHVLAMLIGG